MSRLEINLSSFISDANVVIIQISETKNHETSSISTTTEYFTYHHHSTTPNTNNNNPVKSPGIPSTATTPAATPSSVSAHMAESDAPSARRRRDGNQERRRSSLVLYDDQGRSIKSKHYQHQGSQHQQRPELSTKGTDLTAPAETIPENEGASALADTPPSAPLSSEAEVTTSTTTLAPATAAPATTAAPAATSAHPWANQLKRTTSIDDDVRRDSVTTLLRGSLDPAQVYVPPTAALMNKDTDVPPPVVRDRLVIEDYAEHTVSTAWIKMMEQGLSEWIRLPVIICRGAEDG